MSGQSALIGYVAAAALLGGLILKDRLDVSALKALKAQDAAASASAQAEATRRELAQTKVADAAALAEAQAQERIVTRTTTIVQKVPTHVTPAQDARGCITYGFVRVLDAAVLRTDPDQLRLPSGVTDDTCTALAPSAVASSIVGNYGLASQNAEQLNALEAEITRQTAAANGQKATAK